MSTQTPFDIEAENSVIGSLLLEPTRLADVATELRPEHFYSELHSFVYSAMLDLMAKGDSLDTVTLSSKLEGLDMLHRVGGRAGLLLLAESVPSAANVNHYVAIVIEKAQRRALLDASRKIGQMARDENIEITEVLSTAQRLTFDVSAETRLDRARGMAELIGIGLAAAERAAEQGGISGWPTGYVDLDRKTGGLHPSDLVVLAARPGIGKTSLALSFALGLASASVPVLVYSLEMSEEQIAQRLLAQYAEIDAQQLEHGKLGQGAWERIYKAAGPLMELPIITDDEAHMTDMAALAKTRLRCAKYGIKVVIVDYLQLMSSSRRDLPKVQEVAEISRTLKRLARELDICVVALSQLNRNLEQREDRRPQLSDLRDSGAIEQDADTVLMLYRDTRQPSTMAETEVLIRKQRRGPVGEVKLFFKAEQTKFLNASYNRPERETRWDEKD